MYIYICICIYIYRGLFCLSRRHWTRAGARPPLSTNCFAKCAPGLGFRVQGLVIHILPTASQNSRLSDVFKCQYICCIKCICYQVLVHNEPRHTHKYPPPHTHTQKSVHLLHKVHLLPSPSAFTLLRKVVYSRSVQYSAQSVVYSSI